MSKEQVQKVRESGASESQRRLRHGRFIRYFFLTIIRRTGLVNARIQTPPLAKEVGENGVTSKSRVKRSHPSAAPIVWLHTATSQPARSHPLSIRISTRPCRTRCINDGHCFSKQRPVTANAFRSLIVHFHGFRSRTRSARIGPHLLAINSFNKATGLMAVKWLPLCNQPRERQLRHRPVVSNSGHASLDVKSVTVMSMDPCAIGGSGGSRRRSG